MATTRDRLFWLYCSLVVYCLTVLLGTLFSYSFTDPNLVISSNQVYWGWQQWMWRTWFDQPRFQAQTFAAILTLQWLSFGFFGWQLWKLKRTQMDAGWTILIWLVPVSIAFLSYNSLSHDVFNYMFNAKMVLLYQANPHIKVALDFIADPWLRFMHNTHTPAPYGYGWTALSLLPSALGMGKFISTWLLFRLMAIVSFTGTSIVLWHWLGVAGQKNQRWLLLMLGCSPFILSEIVMNAHNDFWMVLPAVASIFLLDRWRIIGGYWRIIVSVLLLAASISIKFATIALIPLAIVLVLSVWTRRLFRVKHVLTTANVALSASLLLFLPLFTARSQFFHPWYLTWSLVWVPLITRKWWTVLLTGLAISSTYRYLPWIAAGGYEGTVLLQQQVITWLGGIVLAVCCWLVLRARSRSV